MADIPTNSPPEPEWLQATLALRSDVRAYPRPDAAGTKFVIEDPVQTRFFLIGPAEYAFISQLDGQCTVSEALGRCRRQQPSDCLDESQAEHVVRWLVEAQLLRSAGGAQGERLHQFAQLRGRRAAWRRLNPLAARLPLVHPDGWLRRLAPRLRWLFSWTAGAVLIVLLAAAVWRVSGQWPRFEDAARGVLSPERWLWIAGCWLGLKVLHELSHGVVCRMYGGNVREAGLMLLYLLPVAYVDVTSSWRFRSKWPRIHTAAAGMLAELLLASLAALAWSATDAGVLNDLCFHLTLTAGLTTVVFNANPLMRFDGYYMLSDLLEIPNLYAGGQQQLSDFARRLTLGLPPLAPAKADGPGWLLGGYGGAVLMWRVLVLGGILLMLSQLFYGAGLVLAVLAAATWLAAPLLRLLRYVTRGSDVTPQSRRRFLLVVGSAAAALLLLLALPWPARPTAPALVQYAPLTVVRSSSPGLVREILVRDGQQVAAGQPLARLENRQLQYDVDQCRREIAMSRIRAVRHQQFEDQAAYEAERQRMQTLEQQLAEATARLEALVMRAPVAGSVLCRGLRNKVGLYLHEGDELLSIGNPRRKELQISLDQRQLEAVERQGRPHVRIRLPGHAPFEGRLSRLKPQASRTPPHESLCAPYGGTLPVIMDEQNRMRLVQPRFTARVPLDGDRSAALRAGQRATAKLIGARQSIYQQLRNWVKDWIDART